MPNTNGQKDKLITRIKNKIKESREIEKKKLKEMTIREKLDYIWEYYRLHIIGVIVLCIFTGSMLNTLVFNPAKKSFAGVAFLGYYIDNERLENLADDLSVQLIEGEDYEKFAVYSYSYIINTEDPEVNNAMIQRFMAMITAGELDLLILGNEDFEYMAAEGYYHNLNEIEGLDLSKYGDSVLYATLSETEEELPFCLDISGNEYIRSMGLNPDGKVIGIVSNTKKSDNAAVVLSYILN